jgi:hypothetical protein
MDVRHPIAPGEGRVAPERASAAASRELADMLGRSLGICTTCGEAVFTTQSSTRFQGDIAHVRCAVAGRTPPGAPILFALPRPGHA